MARPGPILSAFPFAQRNSPDHAVRSWQPGPRPAPGGCSPPGWSEAEGRPSRTIKRPATPDVFDAGTFDLLVRSAALSEGYAIEVRGLLADPDTIAILRARVTGSDSVRAEGDRFLSAWVVDMEFAGLASTMWIEKTARRLLRQTIRLSPDATILMERHP